MNNFICFGCQERGEPVTPCTGLCVVGRCDRGCMPTKTCKPLTKKYGHLTTMTIKCGNDEKKCKLCMKSVERQEVKMCTCDPDNPKPCTCGEDGKCDHSEK